MEVDIADGKLGTVGAYDLEFKDKALKLEVKAGVPADEPLVEAGIMIKIPAGAVLDALAKAIPGGIDDAVIGLIKTGLGL